MNKVIFIDRDGVINYDPMDYIKRPEDFKFLDGVFDSFKILTKLGFKILIISNQAGVGDGEFTSKDLDKVTEYMMRELIRNGTPVAGIFYCQHGKKAGCACRKPKTGLFEKAALAFPFNPKETYFIGDKVTDMEAGKKMGLKTVFVLTGHGQKDRQKLTPQTTPDLISDDLRSAVRTLFEKKG